MIINENKKKSKWNKIKNLFEYTELCEQYGKKFINYIIIQNIFSGLWTMSIIGA